MEYDSRIIKINHFFLHNFQNKKMIAINLLGKIPQQLLKINSPMVILLAACSNESNNNTRMHYKRTQPMAWDEFFARESTEKVTKETFLRFIEAFKLSRGKRGGGQIEFIEAALKKLETYGLHKDLDVYKALLKLFPEGELIPKTMFQRMYWWNPQQQSCAIDVLDELEWQGVKPDKELLDIMVARFGKLNFSTKKVHRQLYWLPKLWHTNKYLDRRKVDNKKLLDVELAKIALKMICRDAGTQITSFKAPFVDTPDSFNWIASAQSPLQKRLVADLLEDSTCFVDGPFRVWVRENMMHFVVLSASPTISKDEEFVHMRTSHFVNSPKELHQKLWEFTPNVNVHQQSDQTILALAILGVHSHDYASAWLNHLLEENYQLSKISVLFRLREIQKSIFKFQRDASGAG